MHKMGHTCSCHRCNKLDIHPRNKVPSPPPGLVGRRAGWLLRGRQLRENMHVRWDNDKHRWTEYKHARHAVIQWRIWRSITSGKLNMMATSPADCFLHCLIFYNFLLFIVLQLLFIFNIMEQILFHFPKPHQFEEKLWWQIKSSKPYISIMNSSPSFVDSILVGWMWEESEKTEFYFKITFLLLMKCQIMKWI